LAGGIFGLDRIQIAGLMFHVGNTEHETSNQQFEFYQDRKYHQPKRRIFTTGLYWIPLVLGQVWYLVLRLSSLEFSTGQL
jgi:hypothetical protein